MMNFILKFKSWLLAFLIGGVVLAAGTPAINEFRNPDIKPITIREQLVNKTFIEKANIKAQEIAKVNLENQRFTAGDFEIEITSPIKKIENQLSKQLRASNDDAPVIFKNPFNGDETATTTVGELKRSNEFFNQEFYSGIEFYAKAWKNGNPLGFGKDGTVEIERFRFGNPPILVDDENGDIELIEINPDTKKAEIRKVREDVPEAIRQILLDAIKIVGKDGSNIVKGKIGNTTSTYYPLVDGRMGQIDEASWALARGGAGEEAPLTGSTDDMARVLNDVSGYTIARGGFIFDIDISTDDASSATFSFHPTIVSDGDNDGSDYITITKFNPATATTFVAGDYDSFESTEFVTNIDLGSLSTGSYQNFTVNASGLADINANKTGYLHWMGREGHDFENVSIASSSANRFFGYMSEDGGSATTRDPKITIEHAAAAVAPNYPPIIWFD